MSGTVRNPFLVECAIGADGLRERQPRLGALMLVTHDEWVVARRKLSIETLARVTDTPAVRLPALAA